MRTRIRLRPAACAAFATVCAGAVLGLTVSWWLLVLVPVGVFAPGILRRYKVLRDADEFMLAAQNEAAWTALCAVTFAATVLLAMERSAPHVSSGVSDGLLVVLIVGLVTYASAYLFRFWDGRRAGSYLLIGCGVAWGLFVLLSEWGNLQAMLIEGLAVAIPIFGLAALGRLLPRVSGVAAIALAATAAVFFRVYDRSGGSGFVVLAALVAPLGVAGIGFLTKRRGEQA